MGIVLLDPNGNVVVKQGKCAANSSLVDMKNIGGEVGAAYLAISYAYQLRCKKLKVFHDYQGIGFWSIGKWDAYKPASKVYVQQVNKFQQHMDITFHKVKAHAGNTGNECADFLANYALDNLIM